ncbi:MAG TPA: cytochrome o ubiquinol oxidase subunit IV [Gammaproteobacteria bacterium]|jgi:cytochrome o ubiquinol oxidase operon protein cyoD|nr:cytochrome o ubiquinol oxidase subunit IV [Gammaproteobacteria bacterium]
MDHQHNQVDYGSGQKKLSIYLSGMVMCVLLTLLAFYVVMAGTLPKWAIFTVIYSAACMQFFVQLICFLRMNVRTEQGRLNVMCFVFTAVILTCIILGSLWIMWSLDYNMMH